MTQLPRGLIVLYAPLQRHYSFSGNVFLEKGFELVDGMERE